VQRPGPARPPPPGPAPVPALDCEAEVIPGLERFAHEELATRLGGRMDLFPATRPGTVRFRLRGDPGALLGLRAVAAVYLTRVFAVPRPRGLLGNEQFGAILALIAQVRRLQPAAFHTFRLSAAGEDSSVLTRLKTDLAARTGLAPGGEEADLLLRLRRAADGTGWEVLVRLTPRPLTARGWRVCNLPGALNAVVAHAMARLAAPAPGERYLNLACGSGTLLVERLALGPARWALGCDFEAPVLACARANLAAARLRDRARLVQADAGRLPLPDAACDAITADLPFGQLVGSHAGNERLYPRLLAEATRVAAPGARLVLITHEVRLLDRLLAEPALAAAWRRAETIRVTLPFGAGGLNPRIFVLRRRAAGDTASDGDD
jgi:SAM-dependent methyltransferase